MTLALGVLISGTGSNMVAVLDAIDRGEVDAKVAVVLSNKAGAPGLDKAAGRGVPTCVLFHRDHPTRELYDQELVRLLAERGVDLVVMAGFMRVVTPVFLRGFPDRVVNIHPSLLPAFPGVDAQAQAFAYGAKVAGCTVHFVEETVDAGPIILQATVPVLDDDTRDSLAARILIEEHRLLPRALAGIAGDQVRIERDPITGRGRVRWSGAAPR